MMGPVVFENDVRAIMAEFVRRLERVYRSGAVQGPDAGGVQGASPGPALATGNRARTAIGNRFPACGGRQELFVEPGPSTRVPNSSLPARDLRTVYPGCP